MTVDFSFDDGLESLQAEFARVLGTKRQIRVANSYPQPTYANRHIHVLVPEDFKWGDCLEEIFWQEAHDINSFIGHGDIPELCLEPLLIHGHTKKFPFCRNDFFCHVYGYRPPKNLNPKFIRQFYEKWTYLNAPSATSSDAPEPEQLDFGISFWPADHK